MIKNARLILAYCLLFAFNTGAFAVETAGLQDVKHLAEQGDAVAQAKLGAMYHLGREVEKNEEQAMHWMLKAAEQNYLDAEVFVAAMYDRGMGVPQNVDLATHWYEKAAAKGQETAKGLLGSFKNMRLRASAQVPYEYAKKILKQK
jgi:uncharacterized protein